MPNSRRPAAASSGSAGTPVRSTCHPGKPSETFQAPGLTSASSTPNICDSIWINAASCSACPGLPGQPGCSVPGGGLLGVGVLGAGLGGAIVGLGVGVMSADAKFADATPIPTPSASTPEAIATAVFVEADTFVAPLSSFRHRHGCGAVKLESGSWQSPGRNLAGSCQCGPLSGLG